MADKYDNAIAFLKVHPDQIADAWGDRDHAAGCLFDFASPDPQDDMAPQWATDAEFCGCLTTIRMAPHAEVAWTPELTKAIAADKRIPESSRDIRVSHLGVFAEWQRRLDKELNRQ